MSVLLWTSEVFIQPYSVSMSFFLRIQGQVDDVDTTTPMRFIDWWTGINKRALLYHFLLSLSSFHPLFPPSSFFILSAPL